MNPRLALVSYPFARELPVDPDVQGDALTERAEGAPL
jgi:hypothetical protein